MVEDYGAKISKPGFNATDVPTEANKKNFIVLDASDSQKLVLATIVSATTYTHSLGYVPIYYVFAVNSATSPTIFTRQVRGVIATTTTISGFTNPSYIMLFHRS